MKVVGCSQGTAGLLAYEHLRKASRHVRPCVLPGALGA